MKKLIIALTIGLVSLSANAAWLSTNLTTLGAFGTNYALLGTDARINTIQVTTGPANILSFYDSATSASNYVTGEYVSYSSFLTNITQNVVTTTGLTNYMTNSYVWTFAVTNAPATNKLPIVYSLAVAASTTTDPFVANFNVSKGLAVTTTSTNVTLLINYDPLF